MDEGEFFHPSDKYLEILRWSDCNAEDIEELPDVINDSQDQGWTKYLQ